MMNPLNSWPRQAIAGALILAIGGGGGAIAVRATRPPIEMAPMHPVAIRSLPTQSGIVAVRARVVERYGNKFVADDGTGRTLIDLGPAGDEERLVSDGQIVTAQGRFERSVLHASFLVDAGGAVHALGPVGHPPHGPGRPDGPPPPAGKEPPQAPPPPPAQ